MASQSVAGVGCGVAPDEPPDEEVEVGVPLEPPEEELVESVVPLLLVFVGAGAGDSSLEHALTTTIVKRRSERIMNPE